MRDPRTARGGDAAPAPLLRRAAGCVVLALLALAAAPPSARADAAAGRRSAVKCQPCHGIDGLSKLPEAPNLAGQPEPYLLAQLKAYRDGARTNELMNTMAKTLSDQEIADLAQWYAGIEVTATVPPQ